MTKTHLPLCEDFTFKNGDVRILITDTDGQKKVGMVCSQAMCLASPVWEKFIYPPFPKLEPKLESEESSTQAENQAETGEPSESESKFEEKGENATVKEVDFTEDDSTALLVLLRIAHLHFVSVDKKLEFETLKQVALLCDQYDCVRLVSMFLVHWLADAAVDSQKDGHEGWLFIAWVFGRNQIFVNLADRMVQEVEVSQNGEILGYDSNAPMAPGIIENILEIRKTIIQSLLDPFYDYAESFYGQTTPKCPIRHFACDATTYGCLVLALDKAGLWPRKTAAEICGSIRDLSSKLRGIPIYQYSPHGYSNGHSQCKTLHPAEVVNKIMTKISTPVLDSHLRHMTDVQSSGI